MDDVDPQTTGKLREWQLRRLAIKDEMQASPERTLELSRVLDLMDDEHEQILHDARSKSAEADSAASVVEPPSEQPSMDAAAGQSRENVKGEPPTVSAVQRIELRLNIAAGNLADLRKLLEMAVHELDGRLESHDRPTTQRTGRTGRMSGTLGEYRFEMDIGGKTDE